MPLDLLLRDADLPDGRQNLDIAVTGGRIVAIGPNIEAQAATVVDARGQLVSPPFVDSHFHMDATLSLGNPRLAESGTHIEGAALLGELKSSLTVEAVIGRALKYCELAVAPRGRILASAPAHVVNLDVPRRPTRARSGALRPDQLLNRLGHFLECRGGRAPDDDFRAEADVDAFAEVAPSGYEVVMAEHDAHGAYGDAPVFRRMGRSAHPYGLALLQSRLRDQGIETPCGEPDVFLHCVMLCSRCLNARLISRQTA